MKRHSFVLIPLLLNYRTALSDNRSLFHTPAPSNRQNVPTERNNGTLSASSFNARLKTLEQSPMKLLQFKNKLLQIRLTKDTYDSMQDLSRKEKSDPTPLPDIKGINTRSLIGEIEGHLLQMQDAPKKLEKANEALDLLVNSHP